MNMIKVPFGKISCLRPMIYPEKWRLRRKRIVQTSPWMRREKSRLLEVPKHAGSRGAARPGLTSRNSRRRSRRLGGIPKTLLLPSEKVAIVVGFWF